MREIVLYCSSMETIDKMWNLKIAYNFYRIWTYVLLTLTCNVAIFASKLEVAKLLYENRQPKPSKIIF